MTDATERFIRIPREGLCAGCGLCESIAGSDSIRWRSRR